MDYNPLEKQIRDRKQFEISLFSLNQTVSIQIL